MFFSLLYFSPRVLFITFGFCRTPASNAVDPLGCGPSPTLTAINLHLIYSCTPPIFKGTRSETAVVCSTTNIVCILKIANSRRFHRVVYPPPIRRRCNNSRRTQIIKFDVNVCFRATHSFVGPCRPRMCAASVT